jgi:hypothetical protein
MPAPHRNAKRFKRAVADAAKEPPAFTAEMLQGIAEALKSGRMKVDKLTFTDDLQPGLRAIVRNTGTVTFHAHYDFDGSRPMLKVGDLGETTVEEARALTKTIRALADQGIDVQRGLHERLLRELKAQGAKWRP